jgi:peptide/nickel transport system substrate-binding protein
VSSRRSRSAAVAACAAVLAAAAGCSASAHQTSAGSPGSTSASQTPTALTAAASGALDKITWALPNGEPTSIDPAKAGDYSPNTVEANLCDSLLRLKPDYSTGPGLATSWKWADDKHLVLTLRSGVTFWNGDAMTAEDVAYSLSRQMDPATQAVNAPAFSNVDTIKATGPLEVTVSFKRTDELFLKLLSTEIGAVSQESFVKKAGQNYGQAAGGVMCTGPYRLGTWSPGQSISITANPHYWDSTLQPKVKEVDFSFITDSASLSSALLSGQVDGSYEVPLSTVKALSGGTVGTVHLGISTQQTGLAVATADSPLADKRLDDALSLTLDYNALIKNVFGGAAVAAKTYIPESVWSGSSQAAVYKQGYDALPAVPAPNLAQAKALVAQAAPKRTALVAAMPAGDQQAMELLTFLQAGAKNIGLDITIKQMQPVDFSNLFYDPTKRAGLDLVVGGGYVEVPDPLAYGPLLASSTGPFNWSGYKNPQVDSLLAQAQGTLDETKSAELFNQAQAIYTKELPGIPVVHPYEQMFMNKRISGAPASFAYINLPWAAMIGGTGR